MPQLVVTGASLTCPFGSAPATLTTLPHLVTATSPAGNITDSVAVTNIPTFGMCSSLSNPTVASATSAASGVLTPQPCVPATVPWTPGSATVKVANSPALTSTCTCTCSYGGTITITNAGQTIAQPQT